MGFELLLAMTIAYYLTRNTVQDLAWKARGEDPPSFRREQARWEWRQARADQRGDDGPGRQFWRNAWADAVASAEERRARATVKSAEKRRAKWAEKDAAAAEDEAYAINDRVKATEPAETTEQDTRRCDRCGKHITREQVHGRIPVQLGIFVRVCGDCSADIDRENVDAELDPFAGDREPRHETKPCHFCRREIPVEELWPTRTKDDIPVDACPPCWDDRNTKPDPTGEPEQQAEPPAPDTGDAEIIQFADWQRPAASTTEKENELSAEITGLRSAVTYTEGGVSAATQAAAQAEAAIAALTAGGTTGAAVAHLAAAMEGHHVTAGHYSTARTDLTRQLQVAEAYEAHRDAGEREFVTSD